MEISHMLKTKEKPAKLLPSAEEAIARWSAMETQRRELLARIEGLEAALTLQAGGPDAADTFGVLAERAKPFSGTKPRRLRSQIEDAKGDLEALLPELFAAKEAAEDAERRELRAQAERLKPEHRKAVSRIAAALEELDAASGAEAAVRAKLRGRFGNGEAMLPNLGFTGVIGRPADWSSPISAWGRHARAAGYLE